MRTVTSTRPAFDAGVIARIDGPFVSTRDDSLLPKKTRAPAQLPFGQGAWIEVINPPEVPPTPYASHTGGGESAAT